MVTVGDQKPTSFLLSFKYFLDGTNDNKDILGCGYWVHSHSDN